MRLLEGGLAIKHSPLMGSEGALSWWTANSKDWKRFLPFHWSVQRTDIGTCLEEKRHAKNMGATFRPCRPSF